MTKTLSSDWLKTQELCEKLNVSVDHLKRLRDDGFLKQGIHWRNIGRPQAARPTYRWHLKRCEQALEIPQERRG